MKFAHLGDCHLGGWRQPELRELNFQSFRSALKTCLREKVEFILIAGDLFDSPYPPIEILKETFEEFRKVKEANIPVFIIAGSHDYSVSGKTFLDVLEKAGFCKNVYVSIEKDGRIYLQPTIHKNVAIYGYPGKKSGLEVDEIEKIRLQDSPLFKILMLHTTIRGAIGSIPIKAVDETKLPQVDYLALSHLHINYAKDRVIYSGPIFPNNISELEELRQGSFYIFDSGIIKKETIKIKRIVVIKTEIKDSLIATDKILELLEKEDVKDKIVIIRLFGVLEKGKISDIDFQKIESKLKEREIFVMLKSTSKLHIAEPEIETNIISSEDFENQLIERFQEKNPSKFNSLTTHLIRALKVEKLEDETSMTFEDRLISETDNILKL